MKFYSEKLNRLFDSAEDCQSAEFKAKEQENLDKIRKEREAAEAKAKKEKEAAERKAMAAEVDEARKAMVAAQKSYREAIEIIFDECTCIPIFNKQVPWVWDKNLNAHFYMDGGRPYYVYG